MKDKQLIKAALGLKAQLQERHKICRTECDRLGEVVAFELQRIEILQKKVKTCDCRGWSAAAKKCNSQLYHQLCGLPSHLDAWKRALEKAEVKLPTLRELIDDLVQIQEEFGKLEIHDQTGILAVFTEIIELEDIYLGEFEIRLEWPRLSSLTNGEIFRVIALDPHPAVSDASVTHPHVSDECICLGDAATAVTNAVTHGRFCDALLMIKSVLETYNASSAYVSLSEWQGHLCHDCGEAVEQEQIYFCEHCRHDFCDGCISPCNCCSKPYCDGCKTACHICEEYSCHQCRHTCGDCDETVCGNCLIACEACGSPSCTECLQEDLCPSCYEEKEQNNENQTEKNEPEKISPTAKPAGSVGATDSSLQPDGLGQAAVLS